MPLSGQPTRIGKTEDAYIKRAEALIVRCRRRLKTPAHLELDARQLVGWLIVSKPQWSRATWRQYKAAMVFWLKRNAGSAEAIDTLEAEDVRGCTARTRRTSGRKLKRFPHQMLQRIDRHLQANPSTWSEDVRDWLSAALLTGLRPVEWSQCRYSTVGGEDVLVVDNAKNTNQRAHGDTRHILLGGLSPDERLVLQRHCARAREWSQVGQFETFYHGCAACLARAGRVLWPRRDAHACLYSMRHQFSANAKASGLTREEIAALMGHAVDKTATQHYGRKTAGQDMVRVRPDPADVARVRSTFVARFARKHPATARAGGETQEPGRTGG